MMKLRLSVSAVPFVATLLEWIAKLVYEEVKSLLILAYHLVEFALLNCRCTSNRARPMESPENLDLKADNTDPADRLGSIDPSTPE